MSGPGKRETQRMTLQEFQRLPETNQRVELIAGWVVREPSPGELHQRVVGHLFWLMYEHVRQTTSGRVYLGPFDIILSDQNVVQPDILFVSSVRTEIISPKNVGGPPDLAVEVISRYSVRKDRILRLNLYAKYGIREYWVVNPVEQSVELFRLLGTKYELSGKYKPGTPIVSQVLPLFDPDPAKIFQPY